MCCCLPLCRTVLDADPRIRHHDHDTAHQHRPDHLPLAGVEQREHCEAGAQVSRSDEGDEGQGW